MLTQGDEPLIRLLGDVSIVVNGEPVSAGTPKQACVLACLAWTPGTPVDTDTIIERVWDGDAPANPRNTLSPYVTRLRSLLSDTGATITGKSGTYTLNVADTDVDVHAMRTLAARARDVPAHHPDAISLRRKALRLWRGSPLSRVDCRWADAISVTLEPEHVSLWTDLFDAELAQGNHATILGELSQLHNRHPDNENLIGQYMVALYRCGRGVEALETFRRTDSRFRREFGIDASRRLAELQRRILADDPSLSDTAAAKTSTEPVPAQLPEPPPGFVGRSAELRAADDQVARGRRAVAFVGPGGMGKTSLALWWAHRVAADFADGQLFADLRGYSGEEPVPTSRILAGFLRALGHNDSDLPTGESELAGMYRTALAKKNVLIVLDNAAGPAQVRPLLPGDGNCLAVLTSRDDLRGLKVDHDVATIGVGELSTPDAVAILSAHVTAAPEARDQLERLAELCGHLPLAIRLAASRLPSGSAEELSALVTDLESGDRLATLSRPGETVGGLAATIESSYRRLDPAAREVFELLGAHPSGEADAAALANAVGRPVAQVNRSLRRLEAAHLAHRVESRWGVHDLVKEFAARAAGDVGDRLGRLYDWYAMGVLGADGHIYGPRPQLRVDTTVPPPEFDGAGEADAWVEPRVDVFLAAIDQAAARHRDQALRLVTGLWRYLWRRGMYDAWITAQHTVLDAFGEDADARVRCQLLMGLGNAYNCAGRHDKGAGHIRAAYDLAQDLDVEERAKTAGALGVLLSDCGSSREARSYLEQARDLYAKAAVPGRVAVSQYELGRLDYRDEVFADALDRFAEAVAVWESLAPGSVAIGLTSLGRTQARLGRLAEAATTLERAVAAARDLSHPSVESYALSILAIVLHRNGSTRAGWRRHREAIALTPRVTHADLRVEIHNFAGVFRAQAEQPEAAIEYHHVALALAEEADAGYEKARAHQGLADAYAARDDAEAAAHRRAAAAGFALAQTPPPSDLL
ncbi:AfsR/SARP family transcriptional regulator [Stackebrandtia nassauensis]|uniref:Transcriptional regulator, SARP family n=1 Tax=Stackebrandtia nassauensis (strain DSM 44728 / CIP 108903 / NRRL B-16338 / NBRC 102104 / LLR-40K-21) TaxID=446470 RepID=D3PYK6_STANL|nr:BTAD domain-containing putative transcriptional regulator [Stackebrandtia nassauensis]ADD43439.1 transcriptional regulator, SARP family [Stackebrandtia nassauensis DSM 44728]